LRNEDTYTRPVTGMGGDGLHGRLRVRAGIGFNVCTRAALYADAYDQLHAATSSAQPQEQSAAALVASPLQDWLRGTRCRHHSVMTNCLSLHFAVYSRLNFSAEHTTLL